MFLTLKGLLHSSTSLRQALRTRLRAERRRSEAAWEAKCTAAVTAAAEQAGAAAAADMASLRQQVSVLETAATQAQEAAAEDKDRKMRKDAADKDAELQQVCGPPCHRLTGYCSQGP